MKATIAAIIIFSNLAFISACSLGIAIITALNQEESKSIEMTVESNPAAAEVFLDGKKLGTAPLTVKIVGLDIKHKIEITKMGYQSQAATVFISGSNTGEQEYLVVSDPGGTCSRVQGNILNVVLVLQKE